MNSGPATKVQHGLVYDCTIGEQVKTSSDALDLWDSVNEDLAVLGSPSMMLKVCKTNFEVCRMMQTDLASNCGFLHVVLENSLLS